MYCDVSSTPKLLIDKGCIKMLFDLIVKARS